MSQFSTNEEISLRKQINCETSVRTAPESIEEKYEIERCTQWIEKGNFKKVCLQFPDYLLPDSSDVALRLQEGTKQKIYVLADTAYESCCVDYVAAAHVEADSIIHFGDVCLSQSTGTIPHLNIFDKSDIDIEVLKQRLCGLQEEKVTIALDTAYVHLKSKLNELFHYGDICDIDNLSTHLPTVFLIGGRSTHRKLPEVKFTYKPLKLYYHNAEKQEILNYNDDTKLLKRRYFLIEKIKDSNTLGIVIGTLGVKNYLVAIERVKQLATLHKKKYYLISVGKITVAKLANFPEIDVFVVISCPLNGIYDSRDFYKPIVTMYDVEVALNSNKETLDFSYDYDNVLSRPIGQVEETSGDFSLVSGGVRMKSNVDVGSDLVVRSEGVVALNSSFGAGYLASRSWKGLERDLGETDVKLVEEGRSGIAQQYASEMQ